MRSFFLVYPKFEVILLPRLQLTWPWNQQWDIINSAWSAPQNDHLNFSFVKDGHAVGKEMARNGPETDILPGANFGHQSLSICVVYHKCIHLWYGAIYKRPWNIFGLFWYPLPPYQNFDPDLPNFYFLISCNIRIWDTPHP